MSRLCEFISVVMIMSIVCIHESIQGGFTLTKSEDTEIFIPTKTILRTSTDRR